MGVPTHGMVTPPITKFAGNHLYDADTDEKDRFYELLQQVYDRTPRHDIIITMGDWNAKLGHQMEGENGVVGKRNYAE